MKISLKRKRGVTTVTEEKRYRRAVSFDEADVEYSHLRDFDDESKEFSYSLSYNRYYEPIISPLGDSFNENANRGSILRYQSRTQIDSIEETLFRVPDGCLNDFPMTFLFIWSLTSIFINNLRAFETGFDAWTSRLSSFFQSDGGNLISSMFESFSVALSLIIALKYFTKPLIGIFLGVAVLYPSIQAHHEAPGYFLWIPTFFALVVISNLISQYCFAFSFLLQQSCTIVLLHMHLFLIFAILFLTTAVYIWFIFQVLVNIDNSTAFYGLCLHLIWTLQVSITVYTFIVVRTTCRFQYERTSICSFLSTFLLSLRSFGSLIAFALIALLFDMITVVLDNSNLTGHSHSQRIFPILLKGITELFKQASQYALIYSALHNTSALISVKKSIRLITRNALSTIFFGALILFSFQTIGKLLVRMITITDHIFPLLEGKLLLNDMPLKRIVRSSVYLAVFQTIANVIKTLVILRIEAVALERHRWAYRS